MTDSGEEPGLVLKIPPPVWALLFIGIAWGVDKLFDWNAIATIRSVPLGMGVGAVGVSFMIWGMLTFRKAGTEIMPTSPTNAKVVSDGPYAYTRNPMYAGVTLVTLGVALYMGTLPYFAATVVFFLLVNNVFVPYEEAKMARQHGAAFDDYKARVKRWYLF